MGGIVNLTATEHMEDTHSYEDYMDSRVEGSLWQRNNQTTAKN